MNGYAGACYDSSYSLQTKDETTRSEVKHVVKYIRVKSWINLKDTEQQVVCNDR